MCCYMSLSKIIFLTVFHQGFYPLVPSAGWRLSHSSQGSRWMGGTRWGGGGVSWRMWVVKCFKEGVGWGGLW